MKTQKFGKFNWLPERLGSLSDKTYLITGANTGAGFEATKILLRKEAEVVMLNRNEIKSKKAIDDLKAELGNDIKVSFIKMDLAELASVRHAAEEVNKKVPKIDALMCNAAIAQVPSQKFTKDVLKVNLV